MLQFGHEWKVHMGATRRWTVDIDLQPICTYLTENNCAILENCTE